MHGVFISYRREDAAGFAGRLADSLERHLPHEPVFRDVDALAPGQDFVAAIEARLRQCRVCLAVIGREWLNSRDADGRRRLDQSDDFVRLELAAALARPEVLLVPVLVEGAPMPPGDALPSEIRSLARRQAVSLRDDMWDADVARLAQSLQPALASTPPPLPASSFPRAARWTGAAVAALGLLALLVYALGGQDAAERSTSATEAPPANVPVEERAGGSPAVDLVTPANPTVGNPGGARELSIPRVSQVGTSGLVYTLMSARLEPGAPSDTLHLRVALENESAGGVNFWDDTFRLIVGGDTIAPSSNLNVGVAGRSTSEGVVRFHVPRGVTAGRLRISVRGSSGDIPLDFSGRAAAGAIAADTPRSARAIVTSISRESRLLVTAPILSASLTEVATRRFANVLRVDLHLRFVNPGPGPILSGHLTLRLVVGDEVLAPTAFPNEVIDGGSTRRLLVEFEVPPPTTQAVLRATAGDAKVEVPLTLR